MKKLIWLLIALLSLNIIACSKTDAKQEVITFGKEIAAIERDSEAWQQDFQTFMQYAPGMTYVAVRQKYNELLQRLNTLKDRALNVKRPTIPEARSAHDRYVQAWSKLVQIFTAINAGDMVKAQSLYDEAVLLEKQFYEQMDDLLKKYGLTRADVGLK